MGSFSRIFGLSNNNIESLVVVQQIVASD